MSEKKEYKPDWPIQIDKEHLPALQSAETLRDVQKWCYAWMMRCTEKGWQNWALTRMVQQVGDAAREAKETAAREKGRELAEFNRMSDAQKTAFKTKVLKNALQNPDDVELEVQPPAKRARSE